MTLLRNRKRGIGHGEFFLHIGINLDTVDRQHRSLGENDGIFGKFYFFKIRDIKFNSHSLPFTGTKKSARCVADNKRSKAHTIGEKFVYGISIGRKRYTAQICDLAKLKLQRKHVIREPRRVLISGVSLGEVQPELLAPSLDILFLDKVFNEDLCFSRLIDLYKTPENYCQRRNDQKSDAKIYDQRLQKRVCLGVSSLLSASKA